MNRHLFDRSRTSTDQRCPRQRFLQYHYKGKGIVGVSINFPLRIGSIIHDVIEAVAQGEDWEKAMAGHLSRFEADMHLGAFDPYFAKEQLSLVEGMLRGFVRYRWPRILDEFPRVFSVEMETTVDLGDGIEFMVKPDLLLLSKDDRVHYREHKTTSWNKEEWVNSWFKAPQLHIYAEALRRCGVEVETMTIEGLYKGFYNKKLKTPRQESPLIYGYRRSGVAPFYQEEWVYKWQRGFKKVPVWECYKGGVKAWVEGMPDSILGEQFLTTPPIVPNAALAETWLRQRKMRELYIQDGLETLRLFKDQKLRTMDAVFPQSFEQCTPSFGTHCPYVDICHGAGDLDPIAAGFQWREPHHAPEQELWDEQSG